MFFLRSVQWSDILYRYVQYADLILVFNALQCCFRVERIADAIMNCAGTYPGYVARGQKVLLLPSWRTRTNCIHFLSTGEWSPSLQLGPCLCFLKHFSFSLLQRYYGKSLPFGKDSFNIPQIGLLTVEQALADYAVMITELKEQLAATRCPVIVFGGR